MIQARIREQWIKERLGCLQVKKKIPFFSGILNQHIIRRCFVTSILSVTSALGAIKAMTSDKDTGRKDKEDWDWITCLWCTISECQHWFNGHRKEAFKLGPATSHLPFPFHLLKRQTARRARTQCDTQFCDYTPACSPFTLFPPVCQSNKCRGNGERSSHCGAVKLQQLKRWLG